MENRYVGYTVVIVLVFFVALVPDAFGERFIDFEKVIDVDKGALEKYFTNIKALEDVFPQNIKNIYPTKQTENGNLFRLSLDMNGISLNPQLLYKKSDDKHLLKITDGDLKGTTITTTLQETWGFDGSANQGTIVNVKTRLQSSGFLSLVNLLPDESIVYTLDYGLTSIVADANGENLSESSNVKSSHKKGHRTR